MTTKSDIRALVENLEQYSGFHRIVSNDEDVKCIIWISINDTGNMIDNRLVVEYLEGYRARRPMVVVNTKSIRSFGYTFPDNSPIHISVEEMCYIRQLYDDTSLFRAQYPEVFLELTALVKSATMVYEIRIDTIT